MSTLVVSKPQTREPGAKDEAISKMQVGCTVRSLLLDPRLQDLQPIFRTDMGRSLNHGPFCRSPIYGTLIKRTLKGTRIWRTTHILNSGIL